MVTLYITKRFTGGTLKGLAYNAALPGFLSDKEAADWVKVHKTRPVKGNGSPWVVEEASFQKYWRY